MKDLLSKIKSGHGMIHNGTFHADDIFATCLIKELNPDFKCERVADVPETFTGLAYDVGNGRYDHHNEIKKRENGKTYAAFGLLWKDLGSYFMNEENAKLFDDVFVSEIDRCDTSGNTNLLSSVIGTFNPDWSSDLDADELFEKTRKLFQPVIHALIEHFKNSTFVPRFCKTMNEDICIALQNMNRDSSKDKMDLQEALEKLHNPIYAWNSYYSKNLLVEENDLFIKSFLIQTNKTYGPYKTSPFVLGLSLISRRQRISLLEKIIEVKINSINSLIPAKEICNKIYNASERKDVLVFDRYIPTTELTTNHPDVKAVIFPTERGGYNILALEMSQEEKIKKGYDSKKNYKRFYFPEILRGKEIDELLKFSPGLIFVHPSGYIATCKTKENAINFFNKIIIF